MVNYVMIRRAVAVGAVAGGVSYANPQYRSIDDLMPQNVRQVIRNADNGRNLSGTVFAASYSMLYASLLGLGIGLLSTPKKK